MPFVGTVVNGTIRSGIIHVGDKVALGPDYSGNFVVTTIKGIHRKRVAVPVARAGQNVTFALKNVRRKMVRKGCVLLAYDKEQPLPKVSRRFEAEIRILYHSTTIKQKYQAMVHCGSVRQTAQIINLGQNVLRTGDRAVVVSIGRVPFCIHQQSHTFSFSVIAIRIRQASRVSLRRR